MLVVGEERPQCKGIEPFGKENPVGPIARENFVRIAVFLADRESDRLGKEIGEELFLRGRVLDF